MLSYRAWPLVCFACRKPFKICVKNVVFIELKKGLTNNPCSQCGAKLLFLGRYFKTPSHDDVKQWRKVELIYQSGWRADGSNLSPRNLREARAYPATRQTQLQEKQRDARLQQRERQLKLQRSRNARLRLNKKIEAQRKAAARYQDAVLEAARSSQG